MSSKTLKNSVEFMLYTNFGIDFEDGQTDKILEAAIEKHIMMQLCKGLLMLLNLTRMNLKK